MINLPGLEQILWSIIFIILYNSLSRLYNSFFDEDVTVKILMRDNGKDIIWDVKSGRKTIKNLYRIDVGPDSVSISNIEAIDAYTNIFTDKYNTEDIVMTKSTMTRQDRRKERRTRNQTGSNQIDTPLGPVNFDSLSRVDTNNPLDLAAGLFEGLMTNPMMKNLASMAGIDDDEAEKIKSVIRGDSQISETIPGKK